jgi:hypothetical protein
MRPALGTALLLLAGCASAPKQAPPPRAPPGAPEVRAVRVFVSPIVDGAANDAGWRDAPECEVPLKGEGGPMSCLVKAMKFGQTIFLLVRWEDPTESRSTASFHTGPVTEWDRHSMGDAVTVCFPIDGPFRGPREEQSASSRDVWFWEATRLDRTGHARDANEKPVPIGGDGPRGAGRILEDGQMLSMRHKEDAGKQVLSEGGPSGSASDVLARGQWHQGWWTLELARALSTGNDDDRDFTALDEIPFDLWVEERQTGYNGGLVTSSVLRLLLPPDPEEDEQGPFRDPPGSSRPGR